MQLSKKIVRLSFVFVLLILSHCLVFAKQDLFTPENITILITSCDKYSQLWDPFFQSLERYWPELYNKKRAIKIYLIANKLNYPNSRVQMINIPNEMSWSDNMLAALEKIKTKYVLVFLDDYWLKKPANPWRLNEILHIMENQDAAYTELFIETDKRHKLDRLVEGSRDIVYKGQFQNYRTSLQLAVWETKALKQLLRPGENAWIFEIAGSIRSSGYPKPFFVIQDFPPIEYINAAHQGHITPEALTLAKEYNSNFIINTLPVLGKYNWRITLSEIKSRISGFNNFLKRNFMDTADCSYRYQFD